MQQQDNLVAPQRAITNVLIWSHGNGQDQGFYFNFKRFNKEQIDEFQQMTDQQLFYDEPQPCPFVITTIEGGYRLQVGLPLAEQILVALSHELGQPFH